MLLREIGAIEGKLVTVFHGFDITLLLKEQRERIYKRLFETGDLFLPISEHWKHRLIELGCPEEKIIVHRMGVDCNRFLFRSRRLDDSNKVRFVSIGRLVEKKGFEYGIRAVAKLTKNVQNIEYTIVGDGALNEYLQNLIQELGVDNNIHMVGWKQQEEVIEILENAHILLAPSVTSKNGDQEGIPVSLMEAMAMGLPIVSTKHSGIPELIENGVSGFLVPERDSEALYEKLKYLVDRPDMWPEMGAQGRKYVEENYNINKLNDRLVHIFKDLVVNHPKG
jgi:colanic acid/amylovoran biosynthesis glycosyltransferase